MFRLWLPVAARYFKKLKIAPMIFVGFLYLVKYIFGGRAIKKQQKKIKITKTYDGMERFEKPKTIKIETVSKQTFKTP